MSAFIELRVVGDRRAIIEAGSIAGFVTSPSGRVDTIATPESPIAIILRGGETLDVYGESVSMIVVRAAKIRMEVREMGLDIKADLLDMPDVQLESDDAARVSA